MVMLLTSGSGLVGLLPIKPREEDCNDDELGEEPIRISSSLRGAIGFVTGQFDGELSVVMPAKNKIFSGSGCD